MSLTGLREMVVLARGIAGGDRVMVLWGESFVFCQLAALLA